MKDLLDTLDRMTAYEERTDAKKTRVRSNRTRVTHKRATDIDAEDTGLEQWLNCGLTELGEMMWSRHYRN